MQVCVTLPPGLVEGLVDNHCRVTGKKSNFTEVAKIAIFDQFYWDLQEIEELTSSGIRLPEYEPSFYKRLSKEERRASNGYYNLIIPTESHKEWLWLLTETRQSGPAIVQRAMLSLYRTVRSYYKEYLPESDWLLKYPEL